MKGLGICSPYAATSGCILVAPCYDESCGTGSPRLNVDDKSLALLGFEIKERAENASSPFDLQFDGSNSFNTFGGDAGFGASNDAFGGYSGGNAGLGIADFTTHHSCALRGLEGNLTSLIWIECAGESGAVAVGNTPGEITLLDGATIVAGDSPRVISKTKVCNMPVRCLGFNPKTNMLGVAGLDGQISVCDLANPAGPKVLDTSYGKWRVGLVTGLSWNHRLGHILATSGSAVGPSGGISQSESSGLVVWDLKARKPASSFRDPAGRVNPVAIEWMPEQMTQLIVGYGDDKAPALQLWDLRNCSVPLKEVKGHTMGLTGLTICPHDTNLLLTSGRDDYTRCWTLDSTNGPFHPIASMQTGALSHHKRIQWHPQVPGLFVAQDTDDDLSVHNVLGLTVTEPCMPAWSRITGGVISGFAGSVTAWNASGVVKQYTLGSQLDEETLKVLDESLNLFCELADTSKFEGICRQRVEAAGSEFDKLTWSVMRALFKGDPAALVRTLGYELPEPKHEVPVEDTPKTEAAPAETFGQFGGAPLDEADGEAFFNSLRKDGKHATGMLAPTPVNASPANGNAAEVRKDLDELGWGEGELCKKVVVGDYEAAAKMCLDAKKHTEALLLAYAGGFDLWVKVTAEIADRAKNPFLRTLQLLMQGDVQSLVERGPLDKWREVLVHVSASAVQDRGTYEGLCEILGNRLYESALKGKTANLLPASVAYMCSGNVARVIDIWRQLETGKNGLHVLAHSVVRVAALSVSVAGSSCYDHLGKNATLLAEAFVDCGDTAKALRCLSLPFVVNCPQAAALSGRIQGVDVSTPTHQKQVLATPRVVKRYDATPQAQAQAQRQPLQHTGSEGGTAPGAVAGAMYPGMPVPWPLPTATQQLGSNTRSTEDCNRRIIATSAASQPSGERMNQADLAFLNKVLGDLIAQGDTSRAAQDNRKRIADLLAALGNGDLSAEGNGLLLNMCRAIQAGDRVNANIILASISTKLWNNTNKNWIMCLKRIVPK